MEQKNFIEKKCIEKRKIKNIQKVTFVVYINVTKEK